MFSLYWYGLNVYSALYGFVVLMKYRRAKQLLRQTYLRWTKYALRLSGADLKILTGLVTGLADLNWHLHI